jgi:import inner membrane translocase subunit TIM44
MNSLRYTMTRILLNGQLHLVSIARSSYGQAAVYRRLLQQSQNLNLHTSVLQSSILAQLLHSIPQRAKFLPKEVRPSFSSVYVSRSFYQGARLGQEKEASKENPVKENAEKKAPSSESESTSREEKAKDDGEGADGKKEEKRDDTPAPPPPPYGNKSPWHEFTETLQSEFQESKEWNESTKTLASSAHQFTENKSVKRARQAYSSTTGAVTSTTANVLKTTAGAVGKEATWTWETPVEKGVRSTVNATGSLIENGTRPIRETEAYKEVKSVIDDGSSSRYGGWVEKEERRKERELRELKEAQSSGQFGRRVELAKEDPE